MKYCAILPGNSKTSINFLGAAPTLRKTLTDDGATSGFKKLLVNSAHEKHQFQPRNGRQVQYYKSISAPNRKYGADMIVTLHELAYAIPEYIWSIRTYPDLVVCFGLRPLMDLINSSSSILWSYDTTFNLGDFYLSVMVVKLSDFMQSPTIPVAFVIHDRKFKSVHTEFCEQLKHRMKSFKAGSILVTDGEEAIVGAFANAFPTLSLVSCWNHIVSDVEMWLKRHDGKASDVMIYKANIKELLQRSSMGEFSSRLSTIKQSWSGAFVQYYDTHIANRVMVSYSGRLAHLGLPCDSITTNMSESLNFVIKEFQGWKENTADVCLFSLHQLQLFYLSQINRSADGFGPYTLGSDVTIGEIIT